MHIPRAQCQTNSIFVHHSWKAVNNIKKKKDHEKIHQKGISLLEETETHPTFTKGVKYIHMYLI